MSTKPDKQSKLLLVDNDEEFLDDAVAILSREFECVGVSDPDSVLARVDQEDPDAVLLDIYFENRCPLGFEILTDILKDHPFLPVIMWTEEDSVQGALEAQRRGAFHYVTKTPRPGDVMVVIDAALKQRRVLITNKALRTEIDRNWGDFIYASEKMARLFDKLDKIAASDHSVLITGETGVGKGLLAHEMHRRSSRSEEPFVVVECAALPETIVENELFGHEKGAYTGAVSRQVGSCEAADRGTLFLDEIGDMPMSSQAKLLRLADEGKFKRLGGARERSVDVRIVAATNRQLGEAVAKEEFRRDLFYRLNTFHIDIPPLRERREDIVPLAVHFASLRTHACGERFALSDPAQMFLQAREWPGNARELKHAVERACVMSESPVLSLHDFVLEGDGASQVLDYEAAKEQVLLDFKRSFVLEALRRNRWNIARAAEESGVSRPGFYRFMDETGVKRPESEEAEGS
jgi:two-component system NtrC family response regulator